MVFRRLRMVRMNPSERLANTTFSRSDLLSQPLLRYLSSLPLTHASSNISRTAAEVMSLPADCSAQTSVWSQVQHCLSIIFLPFRCRSHPGPIRYSAYYRRHIMCINL